MVHKGISKLVKNVLFCIFILCVPFCLYNYSLLYMKKHDRNSRRLVTHHYRNISRLNGTSSEEYDGYMQNSFKFPQTLKYPIKIQPNLKRLINASDPIYPVTINAPFLIENPELCTSVSNLSVLVVVNTATDHFERRQAIRSTWTNDSYFPNFGPVRVLFLLGKPVNGTNQNKIAREFENYKDILQGDFVDTYYNLTHKGVMGFKWLTERCRNSKIILKVDDDILVNMFIYFKRLRNVRFVQTANVYCDYKNSTIARGKSNKWYVNENHFKGQKTYSKFCKGKFVSMTNDIMPSLYASASDTPFFHLDDVLLFGYVMHNVPGLKYQTLLKDDMQKSNTAAIRCLKSKGNKCPYFVIQATGRQEMTETWSAILRHFYK